MVVTILLINHNVPTKNFIHNPRGNVALPKALRFPLVSSRPKSRVCRPALLQDSTNLPKHLVCYHCLLLWNPPYFPLHPDCAFKLCTAALRTSTMSRGNYSMAFFANVIPSPLFTFNETFITQFPSPTVTIIFFLISLSPIYYK